MRDKNATIKKIFQSAMNEFTEYGFEQASVRTIAKNAGVTPGAIYKHFKSKEDIFKAIVSPILDYLYKRNIELTNQAIAEIKLNGLECFEKQSDNSNEELLGFICKNASVFNLLFNCSQHRLKRRRCFLFRVCFASSHIVCALKRARLKTFSEAAAFCKSFYGRKLCQKH